MFSIGEFALHTGLNIKTLRHYDDVALLPAAHVDPHNGYRYYTATQINTAAHIRVLRACGLSISTIKEILKNPDSYEENVQKQREQLTVSRRVEDWALDHAHLYRSTPSVEEITMRKCASLSWVGCEVSLPLEVLFGKENSDASQTVNQKLQHQFETLCSHLHQSGLLPDSTHADSLGGSWLSMRVKESTHVVLTLCTSLERPLPTDFSLEGIAVTSGTLPPRKEAFLREFHSYEEISQMENLSEQILPGGPLPSRASIALAIYAEDLGINKPLEIRQKMYGDDAGIHSELSITVHKIEN